MRRIPVSAVSVLAVACILHAVGVLSYLLREGRLAIVPIYDDVVYLIDALTRVAVFDRAGVVGYLADFYVHPAHAPFVALTGTLGFLLSAGALWGPYLLNGVWVLFVLCLGLLVLRPSNLWIRVGILLSLLAVPIFGNVLAEFRPDPVWGLLVGFAMAVMASTDLTVTGRRRLILLGLLFGMAVVAKPTAALASMAVLGLGLLVQVSLTVLLLPGMSRRNAFRVCGFVALGGACLVVPYLLTNGAGIAAYVSTVMQGESIWKTRTSAWGHMSYYLKRDVGPLMLGWIWYAALPIFVASFFVLLRARDRKALVAFVTLLVAVFASYLIVTVSEVKSLMIGSILYGTIVATTAWCLGQLATRVRLRARAVLVLGFAMLCLLWTPRAGMIHRTDPDMAATQVANRAALPAVLDALRTSAGASVLVSVPGPAYAGTLEFLALQAGTKARFVAGYTWNQWSQFEQGVAQADVVVVSEAGMRGQALGFSFPSVQFQPRLLETLRESRSFRGSPVYTDQNGRSVWVFKREPR